MDGITDTCKDKGIDLVIFTIPWQGEFNYHHALEKYSKKKGCKYLDLYYHMDEASIDVNKDYMDAGHLNPNGAKKVTEYLGKYLCGILD